MREHPSSWQQLPPCIYLLEKQTDLSLIWQL
jgi:hypothetical protein